MWVGLYRVIWVYMKILDFGGLYLVLLSIRRLSFDMEFLEGVIIGADVVLEGRY